MHNAAGDQNVSEVFADAARNSWKAAVVGATLGVVAGIVSDDRKPARGAVVEQMAGDPAEIVAKLAASGAHHLYIDGGITIQRFLRAGLIQRIIITRVPVLIGEGIPLFGKLPHDIRLRHVATRHYASGLVQTEYGVGD